jgi:glycosyltransferase involved in cell wall biosynthesis
MIDTTIFISAIYVTLVLVFLIGWKRIITFEPIPEKSILNKISVVVACRNEAANLPHLLQSFRNQSLTGYQLILVDDHSTDSTFQIMEQWAKEVDNVLVLKSEDYGKKKALKTGIESATNELIITTDADCTPTPVWLETVAQFYEETNADLIIGPAAIYPANNYFEKMQQLEFHSLVSSGAGAAGAGKPIMCNGANLAFKRSVWLSNYSNLHDKSASGDDVFLLHAIKKQKGEIEFLKSKNALVTTKPSETIHTFLNQRKRWASKAPLYTDFTTILVSIIVLGTSLFQITLLIASFISLNYLIYMGIVIISKLVIDFIFLKQTAPFFGQKITAITLLSSSAVYPYYIVYSAISGVMKGIKGYSN